ncbi:MAG: metallophosphoesterase family protein [Candidatus Omnitrophota bacterium]
MRLVVISDTHIPDRYEEIPPAVLKDIKKADLLIHAGDFTSLDFFQRLQALKPIKAVLGNLDNPELQPSLKEREVFTLGKYKIGLMHGFGKPEVVLEHVHRCFDESYHLVIFGHTHNALCKTIGKTIFFNPGSPTDKIFAAKNSYGIIELNDTIESKIIVLST